MSGGERGTGGLSLQLRPACESIRNLLAGRARDETRTRHRVGVIVVGIMNAPEKYGAHAVEELAQAVGTSVHTLYRAAAVAACWNAEQLEILLRRTTACEQPLSWSHLVILAGVPSRRRRAELVDRTLGDGLTARELAALAETTGTFGGEPSDRELAALHRVVRKTERWSKAAARIHEELLAELEGTRSGTGAPTALLERAIAADERLKEVVEQQLGRLRAERRRFALAEMPAGAENSLDVANIGE